SNYISHSKSVKSRSLSTQSLASCELLFGIFKCSLHFKRFRYKYSILFNFQGPAPFASRLTAYLFYHITRSLSSTFLKRFSKFVSVLWPLRGALEYNTTTAGICQGLFYLFLVFLFPFPDTSILDQKRAAYAAHRQLFFWYHLAAGSGFGGRHNGLALFVQQRRQPGGVAVAVEQVIHAGLGVHPDLQHIQGALGVGFAEAFHPLPPLIVRIPQLSGSRCSACTSGCPKSS